MRPDRLLRLLVLFPLLLACLLWVQHHLGAGPSNPGWLPLLSGAVTAVLGWLGALVDDAERAWLAGRLRGLVDAATSWRVLAAAGLLALPAVLTVSSLQVAAGPADAGVRAAVSVAPADAADDADRRTLGEAGAVERFVLFTSPFGRAFRLHVDGYAPEVVRVFPVVGRAVRTDRDLRRAPALLVRLSPAAKMVMAEGRLSISVRRGEGAVEVATGRGARAAFLMGRPQQVPSGRLAGWWLELQALGVPQALVSQTLWEWSHPDRLESSILLEAGMTLEARLLTAAGREVASAEVTLGPEAFQDFRLEEHVEPAQGEAR